MHMLERHRAPCVISECRIYAAAAVSLIVAATAPERASAALSTGASTSRSLLAEDGTDSNEGNEGVAGQQLPLPNDSAGLSCFASVTNPFFSDMTTAHLATVAGVFSEFCRPDFDGRIAPALQVAEDSGFVIAERLVLSQALCEAHRSAFDCDSAIFIAQAWAEATAEAHSTAVAASVEDCECLADAAALSVGTTKAFLNLFAQVIAQTEVIACDEVEPEPLSVAFAFCSARTYAAVFTQVRTASIACHDWCERLSYNQPHMLSNRPAIHMEDTAVTSTSVPPHVKFSGRRMRYKLTP